MQALAIITEENPVEVQLRASSAELCESAESVIIFTRNDLSAATDLVKAIKDRSKRIEEERTKLVKPFNEGVKQINGRFKAMLAPLELAETDVKSKILSFQKEEERKAQEKQRRIDAERQKCEAEEKKKRDEEAALAAQNGEGESERPPAPVVPCVAAAPAVSDYKPTTYGQTGATSTVKKQWTFELAEIALVPKEYLLLDTVKINQAVRAGARDIAGLRIFEKDILQVR